MEMVQNSYQWNINMLNVLKLTLNGRGIYDVIVLHGYFFSYLNPEIVIQSIISCYALCKNYMV